ncbi:hypothetical protein Tco_1186353 [Tanacetum coccineum]
MFLNMDQLQKQLDNNEFQEIGSMASFKVLETQFQMFIKSKIYLMHEKLNDTKLLLRIHSTRYSRIRDTLIQNMDYVKKSIEKRALHKNGDGTALSLKAMGQNHKSRIQAAIRNNNILSKPELNNEGRLTLKQNNDMTHFLYSAK